MHVAGHNLSLKGSSDYRRGDRRQRGVSMGGIQMKDRCFARLRDMQREREYLFPRNQ